MIEKLKKQKSRAESLKYSDQQELDDIKRKTKLYLEQLFPNKFGYPLEVGFISFEPSTTVYSMDDTHEKNLIIAWNDGKNSLVNLIDTRIEEYEIFNIKKDIKFQKPMNLLLIIIKVLAIIIVLFWSIGFIASYIRYGTILRNYLEIKNIHLPEKKQKLIVNKLRKEFYKKNILVTGEKAQELEQRILQKIRLDYSKFIEENKIN